MLRARGAETCAEIDACRDHFERGSAEAMLARAPNAPLAAADARAFVVDDSTGSVKKKLRRVGWSVVSWHRFSCGDVIKGTPWPESASEGDGFFGAAVVRLPPTKASFAMIASVVAARVAFGGDVWIYGAVTEGLRSVASDLPKVRREICETWSYARARNLRDVVVFFFSLFVKAPAYLGARTNRRASRPVWTARQERRLATSAALTGTIQSRARVASSGE